MLQMQKGMPGNQFNVRAHLRSPLKPAELAVLRAQYEKEGEYVGIQTKFNYAWVSP
jgi:hypothetical protein